MGYELFLTGLSEFFLESDGMNWAYKKYFIEHDDSRDLTNMSYCQREINCIKFKITFQIKYGA